FNLPNGEEVGVVDVPGHRDFIENMLAGVGGIDAAILVIAADEGVMPQTREHLAILDLLQVNCGLVALTKIDLIQDPEWLKLVEEDIRAILQGTVLENAPIVAVSSRTHAGIDTLRDTLQKLLNQKPARVDRGKPRLPVDRVFSIAGFGTVVTGTLSDGTLHVGEEVEILPPKLKARIRGLQTHKKKEDQAFPGRRTAVNLSGVAKDQIMRGFIVAHVGDYHPTRLLDVKFRLLKSAQSPLKHNSQVKLFVWASEVLARVRLLGSEEIPAGEEGWLQLELEEEVVVVRGDRFILRRPSPAETIGGGMILDPFPRKRHKRFSEDVLRHFETLAKMELKEALLDLIEINPGITARELFQRANILEADGISVLNSFLQENLVINLDNLHPNELKVDLDAPLMAAKQWQKLQQNALSYIEKYHQNYPLRKGIPKEELKSRLNLNQKALNNLIAYLGDRQQIVDLGKLVAKHDFQRKLNDAQTKLVRDLNKKFDES
ncbi:MAG: selenocysteine-specific translation elongation factor, partial [Anaerolineales bacterium]